MTQLLQEAFKKAASLSDDEQNVFANWILEELASEQCWQKAFARSEDSLAKLADEGTCRAPCRSHSRA